MRTAKVLHISLLAGLFLLGVGAVPSANALTCTPTDANNPATCTGADPFPVYYSTKDVTSPGVTTTYVNPPSDSLNGSESLAKFDDYSGSSFGILSGDYASYFSFSNLTDTTGDWSFDATAAAADGFDLLPTMLAIKADSFWGFYSFDAGTLSGSWDTGDGRLNSGDSQPFMLSHLVFYDGSGGGGANPPGEVPLPAALPLFGTALVGAGLIGWRKRRRAV